MNRQGTAQMCGCCDMKTVAVSRPTEGVLEVVKKTHGEFHSREFDLGELVTMLDPKGTSFTAV